MDKFKTLEPIRLYGSAAQINHVRFQSKSSAVLKAKVDSPLIGRLPSDLHLLILTCLPIPDIPSYSRACRASASLSRHEKVWEARWLALGVDRHDLSTVLEQLEAESTRLVAASRESAPPILTVEELEDDFGDFNLVSSGISADFGEFSTAPASAHTFRSKYIRAHNLLKPLTSLLSSPPHLVLTSLASALGRSNSSLRQQAKALYLLSCFLSASVQPCRAWPTLAGSLRLVMDRFEASLLAAFDVADSKQDEPSMREAAFSSWEVRDRDREERVKSAGGHWEWELGKVWAEKREIFYEQAKWDPLANIKSNGKLEFDAMDEFMGSVIAATREDGARAVKVFPPESGVLLVFAERLANDVVGEYITTLLAHAREAATHAYLMATAASFKEAWKLVDVILEVAKEKEGSIPSRTRVEDVVYKMFETNIDEYLDEEVETVNHAFDMICGEWQKTIDTTSSSTTRFLSSQNPAQVKRNVLASFTDVLILPVTIVPRAVGAVGAVLTTSGRGAAQGIAMLNPQRWGGGGANGYSRNVGTEDVVIFNHDDDDEREDRPVPTQPSPNSSDPAPKKLDVFLSLEVALQLIHADRESLKRVETFAGFPGHYGSRVRDSIEELFILFLKAIGERHIEFGFSKATSLMTSYKPGEQETKGVAPLLQFLELVHVGDTIQSMVQVYFDKDLAPYIDRTDFLNAVMREKKRFENVLDDSVAAGLNVGIQVLMDQVEHVIITQTKVREYYPQDDITLDLGPTKGCTEAIRCLDMHCKLLKGSTSKEVLEVFYQEVGIRLTAILQKHIKRQIISLNGGFQMIADLNAYHSFVSSLKIPSITADFAHLKMLGHVFIVEDAKDLAQIVRDVTRYGGAYRPEDIYEFVQRRSDWKKIEKAVDKTMYSLSFKEDCTIS